MTDFSKRLDEVSARVQDHVQQEEQAAKTKRRDQIAATTSREEAINSAHRVTVQFMKKYIEPVVREMQEKIRGGMRDGYGCKEDGFVAQDLKYSETEYLSFKVHFSPQGIELAVEASCVNQGVVYTQKSKPVAAENFNEKEAQTWFESHALEAYEAFGQHADAIRNPPPVFTYKA